MGPLPSGWDRSAELLDRPNDAGSIVAGVSSQPPAGWYDHGSDRRWWDGNQWGPTAEPNNPDEQDKLAAVIAHAGTAVAGFVAPLAVYLIHRDNRASFARHHAVEAMNFMFTYMIVIGIPWLVALAVVMRSIEDTGPIYFLILLFTCLMLTLAVWALVITASVKAARLERWKYPFSFKFFRH